MKKRIRSLVISEFILISFMIVIYSLSFNNIIFVFSQLTVLILYLIHLVLTSVYKKSVSIFSNLTYSVIMILFTITLMSLTYVKYAVININNESDFDRILLNTSGRYKLTRNIYINSINDDMCIVDTFSGTLDGNGYTIIGLNKPLFCEVSTGIISNLNIDSFANNSNDIIYYRFGVLALTNRGKLNDVHITGNIEGDFSIGGIVGYNQGSIINSSFIGTINTSFSNYTGGIVAENEGLIETSYSAGIINGDMGVGGLVGFSNGGSVLNSYSKMDINGERYLGGIVGLVTNETILDGLIVYGNIIGSFNVNVVANGNFQYLNKFLFTGSIYSSENIYIDKILFTRDQTFDIPIDNKVQLSIINDDFLKEVLNLDLNIWTTIHQNNSVLPYLISNNRY